MNPAMNPATNPIASPIRVEAPGVEPVSLAEMRAYLRLDPDDGGAEDALLAALVAAARAALERETRRILVPGRFRLTLAAWPPGGRLPLPLCPVTALLRAGLAGPDGALEELAPGLVRLGGDAFEAPCLLVDPAVPRLDGHRAIVEVAAGFGGDGPALPEPLGLAIRRLAAGWFEHRGDEPGGAVPPDVAALAAPFRRLHL
ncbi:head-tail connector protein [Methylobacterium nigriterrae]|uniref:head-tail connector protein n=1 Tax=Methylobacterium nigriterrae TaxID=3127512 RepID=UPI00301339DB